MFTAIEKDAWEEKEKYYQKAFEELIRRYVRDSILKKHHRVDSRGTDDLRDITCEIDILPRVHGSALFTSW
jgi:polyribonucleotide nucleotidyltransferase